MNARQHRFVAEYVISLNASDAARRAGYSERTAGSIGHDNLKNPEIAAAIIATNAERARAASIDAARVLKEYVALAFNDLRDIFVELPDGGLRVRPVSEWPEGIGHALASVKVKQTLEKEDGKFKPMELLEFKLHSKTEALKVLAEVTKVIDAAPGSDSNPFVVKVLKNVSMDDLK